VCRRRAPSGSRCPRAPAGPAPLTRRHPSRPAGLALPPRPPLRRRRHCRRRRQRRCSRQQRRCWRRRRRCRLWRWRCRRQRRLWCRRRRRGRLPVPGRTAFRWPEGGVSAVSREAAGGSGQAAGRHLDRAEAVRQARHVVRAGRHVLKAGRRVCARAPAHSAAWSPECNGSRVAALGLGGVHRRRLPGLMAQPALRGPRHQPTSPLPSPSPAQSRASEHTTRSGAQASTRAGQALLICQQ